MNNFSSCGWCKKKRTAISRHGSLFCSNACHAKYSSKVKVDLWLSSGELKGSRIPSYVRKYLFDQQNGGCLSCKNDSWLGCSIPLQVEHIDGNHKNMDRSNLCLLCPNCHAQRPTSGSKNNGDGRSFRKPYDKKKNSAVKSAVFLIRKSIHLPP